MRNYKELNDKYEFNVFPKRDLTIVKGENAKVWDDKGNEYLDFVAGIGVASIGHCNPEVVKAITEQASKLITCPGIFYNDTKAEFLEKLIEVSPASLTQGFLTNSGTESMEAALKFARVTTGKTEFISAMRGFHGRTMGALSATYKADYRDPFVPLVPGFKHVPFNNIERLKEAVTENTAGIILELVQGEGGINIADETYVKEVRELCDSKNILFIADEIQTGFCRTGKMFASDLFSLQPDMMTCAKAIAGGFPLGATLCSDKIKVNLGQHGTTFGGNPLGCAAGLAALNFMTDNNIAQAAYEKGKLFVSELDVEKYAKVREIRNQGLMIGIELKEKVQPTIVKLMERGLLCLPAGKTVLRFLPPLTISEEDLIKATKILDEVLSE